MRRVLTLLSPGMKASRATQRKALTDLLSTNRRHMLVGRGGGRGGGYGDMNNGLKLTPPSETGMLPWHLLSSLGVRGYIHSARSPSDPPVCQ